MTDPAALPAHAWLVEDEPYYRSVLGFLIGQSAGLELTATFETAEDLLAAAAAVAPEDRPALVVLDVQLPGLDGVAALAPLARALPDARLVMLTARDDPETLFGALRAGAQGYLLKGSPVETILAGLQQALARAMLVPAPVARRVLAHFQDAGRAAADYGLTERERDVLRGMVDGLTQKEIAAALSISTPTVNGHVQNVYRKLAVRTAAGAAAKAVGEGLV